MENAIQLAKTDPAFRAAIEPALSRIRDGLELASGAIGRLSDSARAALNGMKAKLDDLLGPSGRASDDVARQTVDDFHVHAPQYPVTHKTMPETTSQTLPPEYFTRADGVRLAFRRVRGTGPTIVFLPGYMSDMQGSKALAIEAWAIRNGRAMLRLDYVGCGESDGDFADATFERWRDDVIAMIELIVRGPVILVGSSMGGWLMLMIGLVLKTDVKAMVGIAAAPDFTDWGFSDFQRATIFRDGVIYQDNPYGPEPTPTHAALFKSGQANRMLTGGIDITCPVRLLHGQCDEDVPWDISMQLAARLRSSDVQTYLVKDGDHRLSRDADIRLLLDVLSALPNQ